MTARAAVLAIVAIVAAAMMATALLTGTARIRGWDWSAGSNDSYCGIYLPKFDFYCEVAR